MLLKRRNEIVRRKKKQIQFFEIEPEWKKEWQGMPEFVQEDQQPYQQIIVSFRERKDVNEFAELLNQKITEWTKSLWYPEFDREKPSDYVYTQTLNRRNKR